MGFSVVTVFLQPISVCNTYATFADRWWNLCVSILLLDVISTMKGRELQSACSHSCWSGRESCFPSFLLWLWFTDHPVEPLLPLSQAVKFHRLYHLLEAPCMHQESAVQGGVETKTRRTAADSVRRAEMPINRWRSSKKLWDGVSQCAGSALHSLFVKHVIIHKMDVTFSNLQETGTSPVSRDC